MALYQSIVAGSDRAARRLKASSISQFSVALLVLMVAAGAAFFNFHLVALPMSEVVGDAGQIGGVDLVELSALVMVLLEITVGIFLLESLRITRLFPIIGAMDDRLRAWLVGGCAVVMLTLAAVVSGLAFLRDQPASDPVALNLMSEGVATARTIAAAPQQWIPLAANMILGFVLPLVLALVAIPLEYLLHSGRTVIGMLLEFALRLLTVMLRLLGNICRHLPLLLIQLHDFLIMLPLWLESLWGQPRGTSRRYGAQASGTEPSGR